MNRQKDIERIVSALEAAGNIYRSRSMESVLVERKSGGDPVTDAERDVNRLLFDMLVREGEGWLSEESADSRDRLKCSRVWLVDPLDGTKEYISGIPEWCISIALLEEGTLVAGGVFNPVTGELFYGSREAGIVCRNGSGSKPETDDTFSQRPLVLGSRSEFGRGEWDRFRALPLRLQPMGSVAYKLARVAAGKADATWTLVPKHEWDVAAGVALVLAARGYVIRSDGLTPTFNQPNPLLPGLIGFSGSRGERFTDFAEGIAQDPAFRDCLPWASALTRPPPEQ
ncbi:MAG TPA: 3'(2'),5'-bisphosphate nucleotidase CysQ [Candidatus Acidoferrales bacterium]|nr:3'(2'),5'-bisphosphate nucleotidase CysQ [Candidatus Acidoferrales bacterium]